MPRTAKDFVALLGLDEDDITDVEDEMRISEEAWNSSIIPNNEIDLSKATEDTVLERLFKKVKMYTSDLLSHLTDKLLN
jgi:hypothetical protein